MTIYNTENFSTQFRHIFSIVTSLGYNNTKQGVGLSALDTRLNKLLSSLMLKTNSVSTQHAVFKS